jgi:hypothetical protein
MYSSYSPATVSRLVSAQCTAVHSTLFSAALAKAAEADSRTAVRRGRQDCTVATVAREYSGLPTVATDSATLRLRSTHSLCTL